MEAGLTKKNSLAYKHPELKEEWNVEKNGGLTPENISYGSKKKVWWKCSKGHEWESTLNNRTNKNGSGCPICSRKQVIQGKSAMNLIHKYPELVKEWHPTKNGELTPHDVTYGSKKRVWWVCSKGHEWEAIIYNRTKNKANCPYCSGNKVCQDNCLATIHPELAKEWNYPKNKELTPIDVTYGSAKKVWWICSKEHEWEAVIHNRTNGNGCPYCAKRKTDNWEKYKTK